MFTNSFEMAYKIIFGLGEKVKFLPYGYNPNTYTFTPTKDISTKIVWSYMCLVTFGTTMYLSIRLFVNIFIPGGEIEPPIQKLFYVFAWLLFMGCCICVYSVYSMDVETCTLRSRGPQTDILFRREARRLTNETLRRPLFDPVGWTLCYFPVSIPFVAFVAAFFAVFFKYGQFRHASLELLPEWLANYMPLRLMVFFGVFLFTISLLFQVGDVCTSGLLLFRASTMQLVILNEVIPEYYSKMKDANDVEEMNKIEEFVVKWFQGFRILNKTMNDNCHLITPSFFAGSFAISLVFNYATIAMYDILPIEIYLVFPVGVVLVTGLQLGFFPQGAKLYTISEEIAEKWGPLGGKYMSKACKGFRPMRVKVGQFFFFDQGTTFNFFDVLAGYTVDLLLSI